MIDRRVVTKLRFYCVKKLPYTSKVVLCVPITTGSLLTKLRICKDTIVINEELFDTLDKDELARVVFQGVFYFILEHHKRAKGLVRGPSDRYLWNIASEIAISEILNDKSMLGPTDLFYKAADLDLDPHKSVEHYYYVLQDLRDELSQKLKSSVETDGDSFGDGQEAEASSASQDASSEEMAGEEAVSPGQEAGALNENYSEDYSEELSGDYDDLMDSASKEALINMLKEHIGRGLYSASEELRYFAKQLDPRLDRNAKKLLNLLRAISRQGPGKITKGRKPRRRLPEGSPDLTQYTRKGFGRTAVIIDVSGSVHSILDDIYEAAAKAIKLCTNVDVFIGDTVVLEKKYHVTSTRQLKSFPIGGGTAMDAIMKEVDSYGYHNIVVISDGQTAWPEKPTKANSVYVPVGPYADIMNVPKWIRVK